MNGREGFGHKAHPLCGRAIISPRPLPANDTPSNVEGDKQFQNYPNHSFYYIQIFSYPLPSENIFPLMYPPPEGKGHCTTEPWAIWASQKKPFSPMGGSKKAEWSTVNPIPRGDENTPSKTMQLSNCARVPCCSKESNYSQKNTLSGALA